MDLNVEAAIEWLDTIDVTDPEAAHATADDILLALTPPPVAEAYQRLMDRAAWWGTA